MPNDRLNFNKPKASSVPMASKAFALEVQTSAVGTDFVAFGSTSCDALDIINDSDIDIEYQRDGAGSSIPIPAGTARLVLGISNANEIWVRRVDQSTTQLTIKAEALRL